MTNLETVIGLGKAKYIGNNAFANCIKLHDVVIPEEMDRAWSSIFRNCPNRIYSRMAEEKISAISPNWCASMAPTGTVEYIESDELLYDEVYDDGIFKGYRISDGQNIIDHSDEPFVISSTYNGFPIIEIDECAFAYSIFTTLTIKHTDPSANHSINIKNSAFTSVEAEYISIEVDITLDDDESIDPQDFAYEQRKSNSVFASSTIRTIVLPDSLEVIPKSMFNDCVNLKTIICTNPHIDANHLSNKIKYIGKDAFNGCTSLLNLYIPNSIKGIAGNVFECWGLSEDNIKQTVHLDLYEPGKGCQSDCDGDCCDDCKPDCDGNCCYEWAKNWKGETFDNVEFKFIEMMVMLDKNGGKGGVGDPVVYVQKGHDMPHADAPERDNYLFMGYNSELDGNGKTYYDSNMKSASEWDKKTDSTLYAMWEPCEYVVTFEKQGGEGGTDSVIAKYGEAMPTAVVPQYSAGWTFTGYYTQPNGEGSKYYNADMIGLHNCDFSGDTTLYANWEPIICKNFFKNACKIRQEVL